MGPVCSLWTTVWIRLYLQANISDLGKVLAGIQVPPNESGEFENFLQTLGYPYVEETENEVYRRYFRA